ncbi:MAG: hypothetical protein OES47_08325, partial [Acidobacteriota bacterium]|nr:hypothetical protein [Acidobacteriota bacterium]
VPGRPGEMWASTCGWVYRGSNGGDSWTRVSQGLSERRTPSFEILPSGRLLAGTVDGVFLSEDQGESWRRSSGDSLVALSLTHHAARPDRVYAGSEGLGVLRSLDGGLSFTPSNRGLAGLRLAGLVRTEGEVLAAVHHAHSASGVYVSRDGGLSFSEDSVDLPTILDLAAFGDRVFAATEKGLFERSRGVWRHLQGMGGRRVDEVVVSADRLFARSGREVFEGLGTVFRRLELKRLEPRRLAIAGDTLWLTDRRGGVFRLPPSSGSSREAFRETLSAVLESPRVRWSSGSQAVWNNGEGASARLLATGDPSWPFLLVHQSQPLTLVASSGRGTLKLEVPLRPRDLAGALVFDGRLLLATTGFGVLVVELPFLDDRFPDAVTTTAR